MSKKTNKAKQKARETKRPRPRAHRRRKRPNPAHGKPFKPVSGILGDPIALHHIAGFILRYLELYTPATKGGMGDFTGPNFITPAEPDDEGKPQ